jgi:hypothetical protein
MERDMCRYHHFHISAYVSVAPINFWTNGQIFMSPDMNITLQTISTFVLANFLTSVISTWQLCKLIRLEWQ